MFPDPRPFLVRSGQTRGFGLPHRSLGHIGSDIVLGVCGGDLGSFIPQKLMQGPHLRPSFHWDNTDDNISCPLFPLRSFRDKLQYKFPFRTELGWRAFKEMYSYFSSQYRSSILQKVPRVPGPLVSPALMVCGSCKLIPDLISHLLGSHGSNWSSSMLMSPILHF